MADKKAKTTTAPVAVEPKPEWWGKVADLLQLYENTLSQQGYVRSEAVQGTTLSKNSRLAHARWMIDQMLHPQDNKMKLKMRDFATARGWLGFVWGVLWGEEIFPLSAIRDHARSLGENVA